MPQKVTLLGYKSLSMFYGQFSVKHLQRKVKFLEWILNLLRYFSILNSVRSQHCMLEIKIMVEGATKNPKLCLSWTINHPLINCKKEVDSQKRFFFFPVKIITIYLKLPTSPKWQYIGTFTYKHLELWFLNV